MVGFIEVDNAFLYIYLLVIFAIVAFAIANTFLMAVMERVRELGLLNALGMRGTGVARLLLAETVLMTVVAMVAGFVLGFAGPPGREPLGDSRGPLGRGGHRGFGHRLRQHGDAQQDHPREVGGGLRARRGGDPGQCSVSVVAGVTSGPRRSYAVLRLIPRGLDR